VHPRPFVTRRYCGFSGARLLPVSGGAPLLFVAGRFGFARSRATSPDPPPLVPRSLSTFHQPLGEHPFLAFSAFLGLPDEVSLNFLSDPPLADFIWSGVGIACGSIGSSFTPVP